MNDNIEKFFSLPNKTKAAISVGVLAIIVLGYWLILAQGINEKIESLDKAVNDPKNGLKAKITELEGIRRNMDRFAQESEKLAVELDHAKTELPNSGQIASLLSKVSDKAQDAGLEVKTFKPQAEIKHDYYAEQPVALEVLGSYHEVATFFDEVSRLPRIVNLDSFKISEPKVGENEVVTTTAVTATTYRFLDEKERPKKEKNPKGKNRKAKTGADEAEL